MDKVKDFFQYLLSEMKDVSVIIDIIDIAIVSILIYYFYKFIRDRRAGKLALGVLLFFALLFISGVAKMQALNFLLRNLIQVGLIAIFIVFQPELRSILERLGEQPIKSLNRLTQSAKLKYEEAIDQICEAGTEFSLKHTGALIVFEGETKLGDVISTGTVIDAECTLFLIRNVFFDKAPLHDGAVVVREGRLYAAGCYLPLSSQDIDQNLGTRHRAGLGMSENSDALVIIVSEETGNITLAEHGRLKKISAISNLKKTLKNRLIPKEEDNSPNIAKKLLRRKKDKNSQNDTETEGNENVD
jgi:diadenylate cyclase